MANKRFPRKASMQYWHRARAKSTHARIRSWPAGPAGKPAGFAGFKAGMTHALVQDNRPNSMTKGQEIIMPVTILECPPITVFGIKYYTNDAYGKHTQGQVLAENLDKTLANNLILPKKTKKPAPTEYDDITLLVHTKPALTGIGRKKPDIFEIGISGTKEQKQAYATTVLGKDITVNDALAEGVILDSHSVTKGKGLQGPVKRFGVAIRHHKSEKTKRGPGSLGPWHGARMDRVAHAGQTGYHQRTERNKALIKITDPANVNPAGGFLHYGLVKNPALLIAGSLGGPAKRLIKLTHAAQTQQQKAGLTVIKTSLASKQ